MNDEWFFALDHRYGGPGSGLSGDPVSKHRIKGRATVWSRLRDAGLVLIVGMGTCLIALALGMAIGMRMFG